MGVRMDRLFEPKRIPYLQKINFLVQWVWHPLKRKVNDDPAEHKSNLLSSMFHNQRYCMII